MAAKTEKNPKRELQAKYFQYQILKQQMAAYLEEKTIIDERINELNMTIDALHKMDDVKNNQEMWSSLGSGAFVRSDIKDVQKVMISLGAGIVSKETKERCIEILQSRLEEITKIEHDMMTDLTNISQAIQKLEPELELLAHRAKNE